jgi:integrase
LLSRNTSDDPQAFLFPSLAGKSGGGKSGLSMAFKRIMEQAEVEAGVARLSSGAKGRSFSLRSFHSLRHSFISALANSGVSSELRRRLSGHASEEMHAVYTHHELETIRQAVSAIPRLPGKSLNIGLEPLIPPLERAKNIFAFSPFVSGYEAKDAVECS